MRLDLKMPEKIIFEEGCIAELEECASAYTDNIFIAASRTLLKEGKLDGVLAGLKQRNIKYTVFDGVTGEPSLKMVDGAVNTARAAGCGAVAGVGGGSVLDLAKCVAALINNEGGVEQYLEITDAPKKLEGQVVPFIAVPATAGTGSEATKNAVVTSLEKGYKKSLRSDKMLARAALVDPQLTYGLPREITARTGMDAITQIIESYTSKKATPLTRALCADAADKFRCLFKAWDKNDHAARRGMCYLSLISGIALANSGLGAAHGIAAGLGALYNVPHGEACAVLLPHVMRLNMELCREDYALLAYRALGSSSAEMLIDYIEELNEKMGIPGRLSYLNLGDVEALSRASMGSSMSGNRVALDIESCARFIREII